MAALLALATGWGLAHRRVHAPAALCVLTALTAVPCLAVSGALLGQALAGPGMIWVGAIAGDILGVLCVIATTSLALGVFGVLGELADMGRGMVGY